LKRRGFTDSGVFQVCPGKGDPIAVYCDMVTDGGGWIVFQRRVNNSTSFAQNWTMYKHGFGDLDGNFWFGLDKITRFMRMPNKLRIDLEAYDHNKKGYGQYNNFHISNEHNNYTLNVSDFTGNIPNQLNHRCGNGAPFSTYDRDNDNDIKHCARQWNNAGYWYDRCDRQSRDFPYTMLNGNYRIYGVANAPDPNGADNGIYWYGWPSDSRFNFKGIIKTKLMFKRKY